MFQNVKPNAPKKNGNSERDFMALNVLLNFLNYYVNIPYKLLKITQVQYTI